VSKHGRRIFVAGHRGLVGSALVRELANQGYPDPIVRTHADLDLRSQRDVDDFFAKEKVDTVLLAAATAGGINANDTYRWDFIYDNLAIEVNVLGAALRNGVERVVYFGSSCVYPKLAPQPLKEEYLLTGPLEPTNEPYAVAKIAGIKLVEAASDQHSRRWISLMPTNLYGPRDNFDIERGHVLPALINRFHSAKQNEDGSKKSVTLWGTGSPRREFLFVDDLARAAVMLMESGQTGLHNVGYGSDVTIRELAELVASVVGYDGKIEWDHSKPDGTPQKLLDSSRMFALGWKPTVALDEGVRRTYEWYKANAS
jgi:GDP-L-fucose synthase